MDPLPLALTLASAATHSLWNYLAKESGDKEAYMLLLNAGGILLTLPLYAALLTTLKPPWSALPNLAISAAAEVLYFHFLGKAYEEGDLSLVYPVARSSPLLVALASYLFLGEKPSAQGVTGILLVTAGVYLLHAKSLTPRGITDTLHQLGTKATQYAVLAALGTTIYSLSDNAGVAKTDPLLYSLWLGIAVTSAVTLKTLCSGGLSKLRWELGKKPARPLAAGLLMHGGYIMVLLAMSMSNVGYILAVRQVSVVLGALLGVLGRGEQYGGPRLLGSAIIFAGVYIIAQAP